MIARQSLQLDVRCFIRYVLMTRSCVLHCDVTPVQTTNGSVKNADWE